MPEIRIVFLEHSELNQFTIRAIDDYNKDSKNTIEYIYAETFPENNGKYKYHLLNYLLKAYEYFPEEDLLIIFLNANSCILNIRFFLGHLDQLNIYDYIFGFRILNVKGIAFKGSPRLPFIDDSIIVMNKSNFKEKGLAEKELINACHFYKYAKNQSILQSLIEYSLNSDDFVNLINEKRIKDEFGSRCKYYFPLPFCLCTESSVTSADLTYNAKFKALLSVNYLKYLNGSKVIFLKSRWLKNILFGIIKILSDLFNHLSNKEFKKKYNE